MPIHECSYWSMDTAGWAADADGGTLVLSSPDESATLRIDTVAAWAPTWHQMVAEARRHGGEDAPIKQVRCGAFAGLHFEARDPEGNCWRVWLLTLGELCVRVSYCCEERHQDRDRDVVDRMLSTLTDRRA